jgi:GNAT superfamily N-acetyltransferase
LWAFLRHRPAGQPPVERGRGKAFAAGLPTWYDGGVLITAVLDSATAAWAHPVREASHAADHQDLPSAPLQDLLDELGREQTAERALWFAGSVDATPVALARVGLPLHDNIAAASLDVQVHPGHRRCGYGTAMARHGLDLVRAEGRTRVFGEVWEPLDEPTPAGPSPVFAASFGARPVLVELRRLLDLTELDGQLVDRCLERAAEAAAGYRLVQWVDRAPAELVEGLALLSGRMSTDTPMGEMQWEPELWDAARWLAKEENSAARQYARLVSAAVHDGTGRVVGLTEILISRLRPETGTQWDTIVDPEHRGHRLGMLLKAANLRLLRCELPGVRRVNTWNAAVNRHMVAINDVLGFRAVERWTEWQLDL